MGEHQAGNTRNMNSNNKLTVRILTILTIKAIHQTLDAVQQELGLFAMYQTRVLSAKFRFFAEPPRPIPAVAKVLRFCT